MIRIKLGDIFESEMKTLVNTINCVGVMGKGIAKIYKDRFQQNNIGVLLLSLNIFKKD